tara:strand:- start:12 stop:176 length:165 start_codon:yes stop_codon:yes gene_type:complete
MMGIDKYKYLTIPVLGLVLLNTVSENLTAFEIGFIYFISALYTFVFIKELKRVK